MLIACIIISAICVATMRNKNKGGQNKNEYKENDITAESKISNEKNVVEAPKNVEVIEHTVEDIEQGTELKSEPEQKPVCETNIETEIKPEPEVETKVEQDTNQEVVDNNCNNNNENTYLGKFYITGYDICVSCCGKTDGVTSSGDLAVVGQTIATSSNFAFGTKLYIEGLGTYTVQDRGGAINGNKIDVLCNNHEECYAITGYYDVYLVE